MNDSDAIKEFYTKYAEQRKDMLYYKYIRNIIALCSSNAGSILDVGSGGMDVISHCVNVPRKVSLDLNYPLENEGIESLKKDFFTYEPEEKFDIVTCFEALEHIPDANEFCKKLLDLSDGLVIVSVPYMEEQGMVESHIQCPIDYDKLVGWFGFAPTFCNVIEWRIIAVFIKNKAVRDNLLDQNGREFSEFEPNFRALRIFMEDKSVNQSAVCDAPRRIAVWGGGWRTGR